MKFDDSISLLLIMLAVPCASGLFMLIMQGFAKAINSWQGFKKWKQRNHQIVLDLLTLYLSKRITREEYLDSIQNGIDWEN